MSELRDAVPGASPAPCEVCGCATFKRIEVGDGFAPICSESCLRAWPETLARINTIARLERELAEARAQSQMLLGDVEMLRAVVHRLEAQSGAPARPVSAPVDVEEFNYVAAQAAEAAQDANDLAKELQAVKERLAAAEQRALDAQADRDGSRAMEIAAEHRAERLYRDRNAVDEKLKDALEALREAEDCGIGGGEWSCGRCVACLSRVNAHLHEQNKTLLTERESARNELGLVVVASLMAEGEKLREPPGPRGAALAAMINTVHRAHEAEKNAPLCECGRIAACIGSDETGIRCCCDDCCGHGQEDSVCVPIAEVEEWVRKREDQLGKELTELEQRAESAELGCEIAYRREPTAAEGEAYAHQMCEGAIVEAHVPMGNWLGHRCTCGRWVWGGGTVCQGCVDAQAVRTAITARDTALAALSDRDARLGRVAEALAWTGPLITKLADVQQAMAGWRKDGE